MNPTVRASLSKVFALATLLGCLTQSRAADSVTMQLSYTPSGDRAHFYLAKESGLFAAEGLDVRIVPGKGAADALIKVATGAADFGESGLNALLAAKLQSNAPVKSIIPVHTKVPDALLTTTMSGISSLKDVEGKKVATSPFTSSNGPWPMLLKLNGVDPQKVTLIKAAPTALAAMLATDKADAIIQFSNTAPLVMQALREAKKELVVIPWAQYGMSGYSGTIVTSEKMLASHHDTVARFVRAMKKALLMTRDDPAAAAAALKANIPETDLGIAEAVIRVTLPLIFNENTERNGFAVFSPAMVAQTWEWVAKEEGVPLDKIDPMTAVDLFFAH
jgi:NitT/TauT family transport system substrate-binding protein